MIAIASNQTVSNSDQNSNSILDLRTLKKIAWYGEDCIGLAAKDLKDDFSQAVGSDLEVIHSSEINEGWITVGDLNDASFAHSASHFLPQLPTKSEEYSLLILQDRIIIVGADRLGAMWGIYTLSQLLGVPPAKRFFPDLFPVCTSLKTGFYSDHPHTYSLRGWFINDEDLLIGWHHSGVLRKIDYPSYPYVLDIRSLEVIVETALRNKINLIIPASFMNIDDPYQEKLIDFCVKRGLYVSQHHIEPIGVGSFNAESYAHKHGISPKITFTGHREQMIEIWRHYVKKWSKYGSHVIWQLGLRGKGDLPLWGNATPTEAQLLQYGAIINDAIQTQYALIKAEVGKDFLSTMTLWMEGAKLLNAGILKVPKDTVLVFSDVGPTQQFSNDLYAADLSENRGGVYYHAAFFQAGPHLAVGNPPEKMCLSYEDAISAGADFYSILNVSNLRELMISAEANAHLVWNRETYDTQGFLRNFCRQYFHCEAAAELYSDYFDAFADGKERMLSYWYGNKFDLRPCNCSKQLFSLNDGSIVRLGRMALEGKNPNLECQVELRESVKNFSALLEKCRYLSANAYFEELFVFQIQYLLSLERCVLAIYDQNYKKAISELESLTERRKVLQYPPFENWYRSDEKIGIPGLLRQLREIVSSSEGI